MEDSNFIINDYLKNNDPICREERQYALFLFSKLKNQDAEIMKKLDIAGSIIDVFFEAAIMRDYWHQGKAEFNSLLKQYIKDKYGIECIIGENKNKYKHIKSWKKKHLCGQWMMNAKPDIAFINYTDNNYILNFIECKYESGISKYHSPETGSYSQIEIQDSILEFLCKYLNMKIKDKLGNYIILEKGTVVKVEFYLPKNGKRKLDGFKLININELLS